LFLIAPALAHAGLAAAPIPGDPDPKPGAFFTEVTRSWLFQKTGSDSGFVRLIGIIMVVLSTLGFLLSGLGALGVPELSDIWQAAGFAVAVSLILLILFWHPWIIVGIIIDIRLGVLSLGGKWSE
jgi:hypothetical protein